MKKLIILFIVLLSTSAWGFPPCNNSTKLPISLDATPDTNTSANGQKTKLTIDSGQTVSFGTLLFMASDGELEEADASASSTLPAMFMALGSSTGSQTVLMVGFARDDSWSWTPGGNIYVSETTGEITQTQPGAGAISQKIGIAITATVIYFKPDLTEVSVQ